MASAMDVAEARRSGRAPQSEREAEEWRLAELRAEVFRSFGHRESENPTKRDRDGDTGVASRHGRPRHE